MFAQICSVQSTAPAGESASLGKQVAQTLPDHDANASMRRINLWDAPIHLFWMGSTCEMEKA